MATIKRERESEEYQNEPGAKRIEESEEAKRIEESKEAKLMSSVWTAMGPEERAKFGTESFSRMPLEWQGVIAKTSPGALMRLATTSQMFAHLARQESIWMYFFERDFPNEWKFCKGELPFFVMHKSHVFYRETDDYVPSQDETAWKRFYLHTANDYRVFCSEFIRVFSPMLLKHGRVPHINLQWASAAEIRNWVHNVPLRMNFPPLFDYRAALAWKFVTMLMLIIVPQGTEMEYFYNTDIVYYYARYALAVSGRHWLMPYLAYSSPFGLSNVGIDCDDLWDIRYYMESETYGWDCETIEIYFDKDADLQHKFKDWRQGQPIYPSSHGVVLFSDRDTQNLVSLMNPTFSIDSTPAFDGLTSEEISDIKGAVLSMFFTLKACYEIPCLYSLPRLPQPPPGTWLWDSYTPSAYMIRYTDFLTMFLKQIMLPVRDLRQLPPRKQEWIFPSRDAHFNFLRICRPGSVWNRRVWGERYDDTVDYYQIISLFEKYRKNPRSETITGTQGQQNILYLESCIQCGVIPKEPQQCGGTCNRTIYCGRECQLVHWFKGGHSQECKKK